MPKQSMSNFIFPRAFDHQSIGKLLGMVSQCPYYIVLEMTVNGDLKSFLLATSAAGSTTKENGRLRLGQAELTTPQRVAMATDAACGLAYLEGLQYAHRDVAARNCMVTQHLGIKIGGQFYVYIYNIIDLAIFASPCTVECETTLSMSVYMQIANYIVKAKLQRGGGGVRT